MVRIYGSTDSLSSRDPHIVHGTVTLCHERCTPLTITINNVQHSIIFSGNIHNYTVLKDNLEYEFKHDLDAEVLLVGLAQKGLPFLHECHGSWAFVWVTGHTITLCRDRFGRKPLYYVHRNGLSFSTELETLLVTPQVDMQALQEYLTYRFVTAPRTIISGVNKLDAGEYAQYDLRDDTLVTTKYYTPLYKPSSKSYEQKMKVVHERIARSTIMRSDVQRTVECFLSGGLDSSIITMLASSPQLQTVSIGFESDNELAYAHELAQYLNVKHNEYIVHETELFHAIPHVVSAMNEPVGNPAYIFNYVLAKQAKQNILISGEGADELYAGHDRYKLWYYGAYLKHLAVLHNRYPLYKKLRDMRGKTGFEAYHSIISVFNDAELKLLGVQPARLQQYWNPSYPPLFQAQLFDIKTRLPNDYLLKFETMGRAHKKQIRTPFFDHKVVEHALTLAEADIMKRFKGKRILRECFKDELPVSIQKRKGYEFKLPLATWFKNELGQQLHELLHAQTIINKDYVLKLLAQPMNQDYTSNFVTAQKLWTVYVLLSWLKHHKVL